MKRMVDTLREYKYFDEEDDGQMGYNVGIDDAIDCVEFRVKDWLSSFNTDSATECFTAVQELKKLYSKEGKEDE